MTQIAIINMLKDRMRKALRAELRYKHYARRSHFVVAVGCSKKGNFIAATVNTPAQAPKCLQHHAEGAIMLKYGHKVDTIYIARFNRHMENRPIHPCAMCAAYAKNHNIKIINLEIT